MKSLDNKLIIYDSNCKVCSSLRDVVLRLTSIPESKIKAYKDLGPELTGRVDADKFKNVMALIDTSGRDTLYGAEGVAYIFSTQNRIIDLILSFRPIFLLFNFFYKTQAYNRYIIATPKSRFECDCFPDKVIKYRLSYIAMTFLLSAFLTVVFGISLRRFFTELSHADAAGQMLLMAGSGWVIQILLAIAIMKENALDYIGHLGSIMVAGLLVLVPWMLLHFTTGTLNIHFPVISVLISSTLMLYMHVKRIRYLKHSQSWTVSWFLLLQSAAAFWIYFFYI